MSAENFGIIVIGGGISGLGVTLSAARRGLKVLCIERGEICGGTSNNSLRIIHGGFRYLQSLDFGRTFKSIRAQQELLDRYPKFIHPLNCAMALTRFGLKSRAPARVGALLFGGCLALSNSNRNRPKPRVLTSAEMVGKYEMIREACPYGALIWEDAVVLDPRQFADHLISEARSLGAEILTRTTVKVIGEGEGNWAVNALSPSGDVDFSSPIVINTAGPALNEIVVPETVEKFDYSLCRAFNLITHQPIVPELALSIPSAAGRLLFSVPRSKGGAIGTAYLPLSETGDQTIREAEIAAFVAEFNSTAIPSRLKMADIAGVEWGLLPIVPGNPRLKLFGDFQIKVSRAGRSRPALVQVLSTKFTTFLVQGEAVLDALGAPTPG